LHYRTAWKENEFYKYVYVEDIEFYAPIKFFKGRKDVVKKIYYSMD